MGDRIELLRRLTQKEAAWLLSCTPRTVRTWKVPRTAGGMYDAAAVVAWAIARERSLVEDVLAHGELRQLARVASRLRGDSWKERFTDVTWHHQRGMGGWTRYDLAALLGEDDATLTRSRRVLARSFLLGLEQRGLVQMCGRRATEIRLTEDGRKHLRRRP